MEPVETKKKQQKKQKKIAMPKKVNLVTKVRAAWELKQHPYNHWMTHSTSSATAFHGTMDQRGKST